MKYKNITKDKLHLVGVGDVEPGAIIETEQEVNNVNFELVIEPKVKPGMDNKETD